MDRMVTRGRLLIHLQKAPRLSKEWGEGHIAKFYHPRAETFQAIRNNKIYVRVEDELYGTDLLRRYSLIWE